MSALDHDREQMAQMGRAVLAALLAFEQDPAARGPAAGGQDLVARLLEPPPEHGGDLVEALDTLLDAAGQAADTSGPRSFGHVPGSALFTSVLDSLLAAGLNRHAAFAASAPALTALEQGVLRWLAAQCALPPGAGGLFTSGGSLSHLTAVAAARRAVPDRHADRATAYLSRAAHGSLRKALATVGVGRHQVRTVPTDAAGRMDAEALQDAIRADLRCGRRPFLVCGTAGTTDRGAVDPLGPLAEIAQDAGAWFHIDGAYGGAFVLTRRGRRALRGIEHADTVALDGHKSLFTPFGCGVLLARDLALLRRAFADPRATYLRDLATNGALPDRADLGIELTSEFRGLRLWLPLHVHGTEAFVRALDEKLDLARHLHDRLAADPRLLTHRPELSIVTFRLRDGDDGANQRLLHRVSAAGAGSLSSTRIDGRVVLRACVLNVHTHREHVDRFADAVLAALPAARRAALRRPRDIAAA